MADARTLADNRVEILNLKAQAERHLKNKETEEFKEVCAQIKKLEAKEKLKEEIFVEDYLKEYNRLADVFEVHHTLQQTPNHFQGITQLLNQFSRPGAKNKAGHYEIKVTEIARLKFQAIKDMEQKNFGEAFKKLKQIIIDKTWNKDSDIYLLAATAVQDGKLVEAYGEAVDLLVYILKRETPQNRDYTVDSVKLLAGSHLCLARLQARLGQHKEAYRNYIEYIDYTFMLHNDKDFSTDMEEAFNFIKTYKDENFEDPAEQESNKIAECKQLKSNEKVLYQLFIIRAEVYLQKAKTSSSREERNSLFLKALDNIKVAQGLLRRGRSVEDFFKCQELRRDILLHLLEVRKAFDYQKEVLERMDEVTSKPAKAKQNYLESCIATVGNIFDSLIENDKEKAIKFLQECFPAFTELLGIKTKKPIDQGKIEKQLQKLKTKLARATAPQPEKKEQPPQTAPAPKIKRKKPAKPVEDFKNDQQPRPKQDMPKKAQTGPDKPLDDVTQLVEKHKQREATIQEQRELAKQSKKARKKLLRKQALKKERQPVEEQPDEPTTLALPEKKAVADTQQPTVSAAEALTQRISKRQEWCARLDQQMANAKEKSLKAAEAKEKAKEDAKREEERQRIEKLRATPAHEFPTVWEIRIKDDEGQISEALKQAGDHMELFGGIVRTRVNASLRTVDDRRFIDEYNDIDVLTMGLNYAKSLGALTPFDVKTVPIEGKSGERERHPNLLVINKKDRDGIKNRKFQFSILPDKNYFDIMMGTNFTICALSATIVKERGSLIGKVHDVTGRGFEDLKNRVLRTVNPSSHDSFNEDPSRTLQAGDYLHRFKMMPADNDFMLNMERFAADIPTMKEIYRIHSWMRSHFSSEEASLGKALNSIRFLCHAFKNPETQKEWNFLSKLFSPEAAEKISAAREWIESMLRTNHILQEKSQIKSKTEIYMLFFVAIVADLKNTKIYFDATKSVVLDKHPLLKDGLKGFGRGHELTLQTRFQQFHQSWHMAHLPRIPQGHSTLNAHAPSPPAPQVQVVNGVTIQLVKNPQ